MVEVIDEFVKENSGKTEKAIAKIFSKFVDELAKETSRKLKKVSSLRYKEGDNINYSFVWRLRIDEHLGLFNNPTRCVITISAEKRSDTKLKAIVEIAVKDKFFKDSIIKFVKENESLWKRFFNSQDIKIEIIT